jgi:hypothetical protein
LEYTVFQSHCMNREIWRHAAPVAEVIKENAQTTVISTRDELQKWKCYKKPVFQTYFISVAANENREFLCTTDSTGSCVCQ